MPNWFYFTLNVRGKKEDVEQFVENVKGSAKYETEGREFDFNHFIPQPDNIFRGDLGSDTKKELDSEGIPNWYDWNFHNWGTKWNAVCDDTESFEDGSQTLVYEYRLRTAWGFPSPVIAKMLDMYPSLSFEAMGEEESQSYGVYVKFDGGNLVNWYEEEPTYVDEYDYDREVYWDSDKMLYKYSDNDEEVPNPEDFMPMTKYSWDY